MRTVPTSAYADGFTLLEVLVALLVLAIGIAGAAGSQLSALRTRHGSAAMSHAVELASSLADRMRANAAYLDSDDTNLYAQLRYDAATDGPPASSSPACFGMAQCDAAQMAQFDVDDVRAAIARDFSGGRILVCRDAAAWDASRRALTWECNGGAGAPLVIKIGWRGKRADGAPDVDASGAFAPALVMAVEVAS